MQIGNRIFLGFGVAVNASTVGVPIAAAAGYMAVRTTKFAGWNTLSPKPAIKANPTINQ